MDPKPGYVLQCGAADPQLQRRWGLPVLRPLLPVSWPKHLLPACTLAPRAPARWSDCLSWTAIWVETNNNGDGRAWARAPLLSHTHMETGGLNRFSTNMEDEPPPGAATVVPVQSGDTFADFEGDSRAMAAATAAARSKDMGAASATSDAPTRCQCPRLMYWHARCIGVTWRICKKEYKNDPAYLRQSAQENARCIGIRSRFPLSRELCSSVDDLSRNGRRGRLHARRRPIDGEHARGARKTVS